MPSESETFFKDTTFYAIGYFIVNLIGFAVVPIYTAYLNPTDYGVLALFSLYSMLAVLVPINLSHHSLVRYYYKSYYIKYRNEFIFLIVIILLFVSLFASITFYPIAIIISNSFDQEVPRNFVKLYSLYVFLAPFEAFIGTFLKLREKVKRSMITLIFKAIIGACVSIFLLVYKDYGILSMIIGLIVGNIIFILINIGQLKNSLKLPKSFSIIKEPLKYAFIQVPTGLGNTLIESADRFMLQIFTSTKSVGLYSFGYRFGSIFNQIYTEPFRLSARPKLLKMDNDKDAQKTFISMTSSHYLSLGLTAVLGAFFFADEFISFITSSNNFHASSSVIPIIITAIIIHGFGSFFDWSTVLAGRGILRMNLYLGCAVTNVILNIILIPSLGFIGAALASLAAYLFWTLSCIFVGYRLYKWHPTYKLHIQPLITAGLLLLIGVIAENIFSRLFLVFFIHVSLISGYLLYSLFHCFRIQADQCQKIYHNQSDKTPNLLIVTTKYLPPASGLKSTHNLALYLKKCGWDITVLAGDTNNKELQYNELNKISIIRCGKSALNIMKIPGLQWLGRILWPIAFFVKLCRLPRPDVIYVHQILDHSISCLLYKKLFNVPVILRPGSCGKNSDILHLSCYFKGIGKYFIPLLKTADGVIAMSDTISKDLTSWGFNKKKVHIISTGVDTNRFYPKKTGIKIIPPIRALYVGRLNPIKGVDLLLEAWSILVFNKKITHTKAQLNIVGEGPLKQRLLDTVNSKNLSKSIQLSNACNNPAPIFSRSDIFVLPSRAEGVSNALLEAMSSGCAVIATEVGGTPDIIKHKFNGILIPAENPTSLAESIYDMLNAPSYRLSLGKNARLTVEKKYSAGLSHEKIRTLLLKYCRF